MARELQELSFGTSARMRAAYNVSLEVIAAVARTADARGRARLFMLIQALHERWREESFGRTVRVGKIAVGAVVVGVAALALLERVIVRRVDTYFWYRYLGRGDAFHLTVHLVGSAVAVAVASAGATSLYGYWMRKIVKVSPVLVFSEEKRGQVRGLLESDAPVEYEGLEDLWEREGDGAPEYDSLLKR